MRRVRDDHAVGQIAASQVKASESMGHSDVPAEEVITASTRQHDVAWLVKVLLHAHCYSFHHAEAAALEQLRLAAFGNTTHAAHAPAPPAEH